MITNCIPSHQWGNLLSLPTKYLHTSPFHHQLASISSTHGIHHIYTTVRSLSWQGISREFMKDIAFAKIWSEETPNHFWGCMVCIQVHYYSIGLNWLFSSEIICISIKWSKPTSLIGVSLMNKIKVEDHPLLQTIQWSVKLSDLPKLFLNNVNSIIISSPIMFNHHD